MIMNEIAEFTETLKEITQTKQLAESYESYRKLQSCLKSII